MLTKAAVLQMKLFTLGKRKIFVVFLLTFILYISVILIGLSGPPISERSTFNMSTLDQLPEDLQVGPYIFESTPISTFHQKIWLSFDVSFKDIEDKGKDHRFGVDTYIHGVLNERKGLVNSFHSINTTKTLHCSQGRCHELLLTYISFLEFPKYTFFISFDGLYAKIDSIKFMLSSYSPSFTKLEIWFRFSLLFLTFIVTCLFAHSLRRFTLSNWNFEQKWTSILLPLLLLYDNPIFPLQFLINSWIPTVLDDIFKVNFIVAMLLYWLCIYHGVREQRRSFFKFYLPKFVITSLIYFGAVGCVILRNQELIHPTFINESGKHMIKVLGLYFLVLGLTYLAYLLFLLVRAYKDFRSYPYNDLSLNFTTSSMTFVLLISVVCVYSSQASGPFNYWTTLDINFTSSSQYMAFHGMLNFYIFLMAYLYSPTRLSLLDFDVKDTPALTLFDDSEDEAIYGYDEDESDGNQKTGPGLSEANSNETS